MEPHDTCQSPFNFIRSQKFVYISCRWNDGHKNYNFSILPLLNPDKNRTLMILDGDEAGLVLMLVTDEERSLQTCPWCPLSCK